MVERRQQAGRQHAAVVPFPYAHDFTFDGRAGFHTYPESHTGDPNAPDLHGPDLKQRADGLCMQGSGLTIERVHAWDVPGTAIKMLGGPGGQAGQKGIYDDSTSRLSDSSVMHAINGVYCNVGDSRIRGLSVVEVVKDGLTVAGPGTYVDDCHVWGADRAAVVSTETHGTNLYLEAARIGIEVLPHSGGTEIDGLNIGPATCWDRGALIESDNVTITRLSNQVKAGTVGVEVASWRTNIKLSGALIRRGQWNRDPTQRSP